MAFAGKVLSLLFNILSRLIITSLPRSKHLLISWLQLPSAVILEPQKIVSHCFHFFPIYLPWSNGTRCYDLSFFNAEFQVSFFTLLFHPHQETICSSLSAIRMVSSASRTDPIIGGTVDYLLSSHCHHYMFLFNRTLIILIFRAAIYLVPRVSTDWSQPSESQLGMIDPHH